jgi:hypothetical protein
MKVAVLILVFHAILNVGVFGQGFKVKGILVDENDNTPIGYANIGILNTTVGTISDSDGTFEVFVPDELKDENLLFAAPGYERKSFHVPSLSGNENNVIRLVEQITVLKNVTVQSTRLKPAVLSELGNQYHNEGSIYVDSSAAGSAMALLIENKPPASNAQLKTPYYIKRAKLRIAHNTFADFKIRIRFLSVDSVSGLPDRDLVDQNIIVTSSMKKGWLKFDLEKYNIRIGRRSFFLVFEWLLEDEDRMLLLGQYNEYRRQFPRNVTVDTIRVDGETITFNSWHGFRAGTSFGSSSLKASHDHFKSYYRNNSYGRWKRSSFILAARVVVANYE